MLVASAAMPVRRRITQASAAEAATVRGVQIGAITGVYGPFTPAAGQDVVDVVIARSLEGGIGHVELVNTLFEPRVTGGAVGGQAPATATPEYLQTREALRQWRLAEPLDRFREIRRKFDAAGLRSLFLRHDRRRRLQRSRNRGRLQADASARREAILHQPDSRRNGTSHGAVRGESTGSARPFIPTIW